MKSADVLIVVGSTPRKIAFPVACQGKKAMDEVKPKEVVIKFRSCRDMVGVFDGRELILNVANPDIAKIRGTKNRAAAVAVAAFVVMIWATTYPNESFSVVGIWNDCTQLYISMLSSLNESMIIW